MKHFRFPLHGTEANRPGSMEKLVGANGEINASSKTDLMQAIVDLAAAVTSGDIYTDASGSKPASAQEVASARREALIDGYNGPLNEGWAELGSGLAAELTQRMEREGFMRTLLMRGDVAEGSIPRIRVRVPNTRAVVARGAAAVMPQFVRGKYITADEFTISANPRVLELETHQGSQDLLEEKFYEAQEQIMVTEDKMLRSMMDVTVGIENPITYFSGSFTPSGLQSLRYMVQRWNMSAANLLFAMDILNDFIAGNSFSTWFDPVSKYEIVQTGRIGNLLGMSMITDGLRDPRLRVLADGELYVTGTPEYTGAYTDRGPVASEPRDSYDDGVAARGWYMREHISATVANARSIAKAKRQ